MSERHEITFLANAEGVKRAFADISAGAGKVKASIGGISGAFSTIDKVATGVLGSAVVGFLADASRAAAEAEASNARLAQSFENLGTSVDAYGAQLDNASQQALDFAFDDEDAADAIANMASITGDAEQAISLLGTAMDLARAKNISLAQASTIIGKVAAGNTTMLARYGIVLEEGATATEALAAIQQRYGGQAEAYANTQAGAIDKLGVSWQNWMEQVGASTGPLQTVLGVLPGVSVAAQGASGAIAAVAGGMGPLALGAGAAGIAVIALGAAFLKARDDAAKLTTSLDDVQRSLDSIDSTYLIEQFTDVAISAEEAQKAVEAGDPTIQWGRDAKVAEFNDQLAQTVDAAEAADYSLGRVQITAGLLDEAWKRNEIGLTDLTAAYDDYATILENGSPAALAALEDLDKQFESGAITLDQYLEQSDKLAGSTLKAGDAMRKTADSAGELAAAIDEVDYGKLANDVLAVVDAYDKVAKEQIDAAKETQAAAEDAANAAADAQLRAAERAQKGQTRAATQAGKDQVREAERAADGQIRAAENAEEKQVAAAEAAAEAQVAAAEEAADAQVKAAERAEKATVRAAQAQAHDTIRAAESAARGQVRAAETAANRQIAAADRLEEEVTASAKAREDQIIAAANREHDAVVERANAQADAQIAAAERATERKLALIDRELAQANQAATDEANRTIDRANEEAMRKIQEAEQKYGADSKQYADAVAQAEQDLAKAQEDAYKKQADAQAEAARKAEQEAARAQRQEEKRIAEAQAKRDKAIEASAARLAAIEEQAHQESLARIEEAARTAEAMRTAAARNVAKVERETAREVEQVRREAERRAEQAAREAARNTAAVQKQTADDVAAVRKAADAAVEAAAQAAARQTEEVRKQAERNVVEAKRATEKELRAIERAGAAESRAIEKERADAIQAAADVANAAIKAAEDQAKTSSEQIIASIIATYPELEKVLTAQGDIRRGADGKITLTMDDASAQLLARLEVLFPSNAGGSGSRMPAGIGNQQLGGVLPAANGRTVLVGEAGRELVTLPVGSRVTPNPATEAQLATGGGVVIQFHGDVYGYEDFEAKVGMAAANALGRALPRALTDRRRALGAA